MYSEIRGGPWLQGEGVIHTHASTTAPPGKVPNLDQEGDIHTHRIQELVPQTNTHRVIFEEKHQDCTHSLTYCGLSVR